MRSTRAELTTEATPCREDPGVTVEAAAGGHPHLSLGVSRCSGSAGSRWAFRPLIPGCCWGERMAGDRRARRPGVLHDGLASRALSWRPGGRAGFGRATTGGPTRRRRGVNRRLTSFLLRAVECRARELRASRSPARAAETATPPLVPPDGGGTNDWSAAGEEALDVTGGILEVLEVVVQEPVEHLDADLGVDHRRDRLPLSTLPRAGMLAVKQ